MTPGIVLAAGASARMGRPKALLRAGDRTFIRRILDTLRDGGLTRAVVVVRPGQPDLLAAIEAADFGRAVVNTDPERGQLSSLLAGIEAVEAPEVDSVLVTLVDVPLIAPATIRALCARAALSPAPIVRAACAGRHGHPVIFKRATFDALRRADPAVGAKAVFRPEWVEDFETGDPGVAEDVDTPEDYARLVSPPRAT